MDLTMTRRSALGLAAGAAAVGLVGCGGGGSEDATRVHQTQKKGAMESYQVGTDFRATEPLEFTILYSDHPNYPYRADWLLWSEITRRTNVTLNPTLVPMSDYNQKRNVMVAAGDAPMIIPKTYPGQETPMVSGGAILAVSDHTNLMPHYTDMVTRWKLEEELARLKQTDKKYYLLPGLHEAVWPDYSLIMRTDILEKVGVGVPTTWDELRTALTAMKQAYPGVTPFSDRYEGKSLLNILGVTFGAQLGWGLVSGVTFDKAADAFRFAGTTDELKAAVTYLAGLVSEGLLDPASFTQKDDQAIQKFVNGQSFVISGNMQDPPTHRASMDKILGAGTYQIVKIANPGGPAGMLMGGSRLENCIMINQKAVESETFVAMMQFIDWLWYSPNGAELVKWGVEGTTFTKDASGKRTLAADVNYVGLNPAGTKALNKDFGFSGGVFAYGGATELLHSMFREEELVYQKEMAATHTPAPLDPPFPFTDVEREQATLLQTPVIDTVSSNVLKFITGQRPLSEWDAYVAECEAKGSQRYLDMVNAAYQKTK